jgi:hypothetical protein
MVGSTEIINEFRNAMDDFKDDKLNIVDRLAKLDPFFMKHYKDLRKLMDDNHEQAQDPHVRFGEVFL